MAETNPTATENEEPAPTPTGKSWLFKLAILGVVATVVGVECLVAYLLIPGASAVSAASTSEPAAKTPESDSKQDAKQGEPTAAAKHGDDKKAPEKVVDKHGAERAAQKTLEKSLPRAPHPQETAADLKEVDLGEFTVTAAQTTSNSTLRITLHLYGTVAALDQDKFSTRLKENQHRFREAVIVTVRGAEVTDLTDAGLGLLRRTILEKTNTLLGEPLLKTVIFSEFSFYEI